MSAVACSSVIPAPPFSGDYYGDIPFTRSCQLFDWPIDQLSYRSNPFQPEHPSLAAKAIAVVAIAIFSTLSLGYYAYYAYRAHTDRWLAHELHTRVMKLDLGGVQELFARYPELKTRKLMYALTPEGAVCGGKSILFHLLSYNVETIRPLFDELLRQGYDLNAPAFLSGHNILCLTPYAGSTPEMIQFLYDQGVKPTYIMPENGHCPRDSRARIAEIIADYQKKRA